MTSAVVTQTPLPKKKLAVLLIIQFSEPFFLTMLFPFVAFMVEGFNVSSTPEGVGYFAGILASSFSFAQFLSSSLWGTLSDRWGRRPVLLCGLIGNIITAIVFGFSVNYPMAVAMRAATGLLNGNVAVCKTYMREVTDGTNQALGFSLLGCVWSLGYLVGPAVGGFLAQLNVRYPETFPPGSLIDRFPYLLPPLAAAGVNVIGLCIGLWGLEETLVKSKPHVQTDRSAVDSMGDFELAMVAPKLDDQALQMEPPVAAEADAETELKQLEPGGRTDETAATVTHVGREGGYGELDEEPQPRTNADVSDEDVADGDLREVKDDVDSVSERAFESGETADGDLKEVSLSAAHGSDSMSSSGCLTACRRCELYPNDTSAVYQPPPELLKNRPFLFVVTLFALFRVNFVMMDEIFSLWAMQDVWHGGLYFRTYHIGIVQMCAGGFLLPFQLLVFPILEKRFGSVALFRFSAMMLLPLWISIPFIQTLYYTSSPIAVWPVMIFVWVIRGVFGSICFTAIVLMQNNSLHRHALGRGNGISQSIAALCSAAGPALGGAIFAWSLTNGLPAPFDYHIVFCLAAVLTGASLCMGWLLRRRHVDRPHKME
eukprot:TRINITY_DN7237_c0_g1_i1.p1 TRINITY_DN7237_c0_g1~~TRINITY_DN7237_c0_g1_i1.p1  ORF type:complete len:599 (-),score=131.00 TRINITY_DN7237_c0_g1_i1:38-1834(-)